MCPVLPYTEVRGRVYSLFSGLLLICIDIQPMRF